MLRACLILGHQKNENSWPERKSFLLLRKTTLGGLLVSIVWGVGFSSLYSESMFGMMSGMFYAVVELEL